MDSYFEQQLKKYGLNGVTRQFRDTSPRERITFRPSMQRISFREPEGGGWVAHREDGPAVVDRDGTCEWWWHGEPYRLNGPSFESTCGQVSWHINVHTLGDWERMLICRERAVRLLVDCGDISSILIKDRLVAVTTAAIAADLYFGRLADDQIKPPLWHNLQNSKVKECLVKAGYSTA